MLARPTILLIEPTHYEVSYTINPWMRPQRWLAAPERMRQDARRAFADLRLALERAGFDVEVGLGMPGHPDMVFPANAAVILDGRALLARFRCPERQGEEAHFATLFAALRARGLIQAVDPLPADCYQEGAGDCIWDAGRGWFWAGFGQRSTLRGAILAGEYFGQPVVPLELATPRCYHLDVCFCPLAGGEVLYYPGAFTGAALETLRKRVPAARRIEADADALRRFSINAVNLDDQIVMARTTPRLQAELGARGYRVQQVDLAPFMLSGGGAYCMTLRLDRRSGALPARAAAA